MNLWTMCSGQKKKVNGSKGAKYFFLLRGVNSFLHHCIMVRVFQHIDKKNCATITGKNVFAAPGPLIFLTTVVFLMKRVT